MKEKHKWGVDGVMLWKIPDYHLHTFHSFDGKSSIMDMCSSAVRKGMEEIGFSEHFSVCDFDPSYQVLDFEAYSRDIEEARRIFAGRLKIKKGLEIGEPHIQKEEIDHYLLNKSLDFIIGSIHNIGPLKLRKYMQGKTNEEIYASYFDTLLDMVQQGDMDVIGHFDLMKRYACIYAGNYSFENHREKITEILKTAIQRGIGMEVNTSGLSQDIQQCFPTMEVLRLYKELGGEIVTLGSDSHRAESIGENLSLARQMLLDTGLSYYCLFENRHPIFKKIQ